MWYKLEPSEISPVSWLETSVIWEAIRLVLGLYLSPPSDFKELFPLLEAENTINLSALALLSSLTATCDAEPADISPTLIQSTWDPVDERTCPEEPVLESLSVIEPEIVKFVIEILGVPVNPPATFGVILAVPVSYTHLTLPTIYSV